MDSRTWTQSTARPDEWATWVRACGGGVFHVPEGLLLGPQSGTPVYWYYGASAGEVAGIALGLQSRCRFSRRERHLHFAALPALRQGVDPVAALDAFRTALARAGAAEAEVGSFDATYTPDNGVHPRLEYVIPIEPGADVVTPMGTTHRRHVRRGGRDGWTTRFLTGSEALDAVLGVQRSTAERAAALSRGFSPAEVTAWADAVVPAAPLPPAGLAAIAAYDAGGVTLLSAVLIGWAAERSFYLIGGSTPEGYKCGAAPWLHVQVMHMLADHGIRSYNLGGTPIDAASESSPAHGLYRFKTGFGVTPHERHGMSWTFAPAHAALHRAVDRLRRRM